MLRPPPLAWVPASVGTTDELGSGWGGVSRGVTAPAAPLDSGFRRNDGYIVWVPICLRGNDGGVWEGTTAELGSG